MGSLPLSLQIHLGAVLVDQVRQNPPHLVDVDTQTFTGVLIDHVPHPQLAATHRGVVDEVPRLHVVPVRGFRRQTRTQADAMRLRLLPRE